jgi:hypothetical protein
MIPNEAQDFELFKADFKAKYDIDIDLDTYRKIIADEKHAKEVQAEADKLGFVGNEGSADELNAKCFSCSAGLSTVEIMLYGNRCVFCQVGVMQIGLIKFLVMCYYDWQIYQELLKHMNKTDARHDLLGCLGVLGYFDINQVKRICAKRALLRELRGLKR